MQHLEQVYIYIREIIDVKTSKITKEMVVLVVGAILRGQISFWTLVSICISEKVAILDLELEVIEIILQPISLNAGIRFVISSVFPLLLKMMIISLLMPTIPLLDKPCITL